MELEIAYIGGGSRAWARVFMNDLAKEGDLSGRVRLYDLDFSAARDNETIGNALSGRKEIRGKWKYQAVRTLEEALPGADFVIISILPGTFSEMASDIRVPEKYGIYQSVGDTVGPGGIMRALRAVPEYQKFARAIEKYCPDAVVINYTNPMTVCTRTLYRTFSGIRAYGCCHEVFGTQELLKDVYREATGEDVDRREIEVNVLGVNHFTWITKAVCRGVDLFPLYREYASKHYEEGVDKGEIFYTNPFVYEERVKFDLFLRYGAIAAAGDRHLAEFCPNRWYLQDEQTVEKWKFHLTSPEWRMKDLEERKLRTKRLLSGEEQFKLHETGEEGVRQMRALAGLGDFVTNVNLPNQGQMPGFPEGAVVETNAAFKKGEVRPLPAGVLPDPVYSMVLRHSLNQELLAAAAAEGDMERAFLALLNDPLVNLPVDRAREMFNEMTYNTRAYLPYYRAI